MTRALIALHATDPASVYLSVLARSAGSTLADVADALYERRGLVRSIAIRRTRFVFARGDMRTVRAAFSAPAGREAAERLIRQLQRNGSDPHIDGDVGRWLAELEDRTEEALARRGTATGTQLADDEPALKTRILARAPSDRPQNLTTSLLTLMSADGRLVRATPTGPWTSRHHRWEPVSWWWPQGLPPIDPTDAQRDLARRWLARFGPATPRTCGGGPGGTPLPPVAPSKASRSRRSICTDKPGSSSPVWRGVAGRPGGDAAAGA